MAYAKNLLPLCFFLLISTVHAQEIRHLYDFATPGGGGYPNDTINDQDAFLAAQAFFQANNGNGTLILDDGEYIVGRQQLFEQGTGGLLIGPNWNADRYPIPPTPTSPSCLAMVAYQACFVLSGCSQFTIQGGPNTKVRYRDCLYYGTFLRDALTGEVSSAVGAPCRSCDQAGHAPGMLHAAVGTMFRFNHCDSIKLRDVELHGNIDNAILGGTSFWDGMQTDYDGVMIWESSRCVIQNVRAHHFGRDGLSVSADYQGGAYDYMQAHPSLDVVLAADSTLRFNNTIQNSRFEWNGRQGISWTACSGLEVVECDMNYNGAGRITSSPSSGLDIEGGGGPMRVRYGVFDDCRFLHNRGVGIISDPVSGPCLGQQDFRFNDCVVKAGESGAAIWPGARQMVFENCAVYGTVGQFYEQAENLRDSLFDLVFRYTNFFEEDDQWSYIRWFATSDTSCTAGPHMFRFTEERAARVTFDHCGFYTNCRAKVRFIGRSANKADLPYCITCQDCDEPENCGPNSCQTSGPCLGCTQQDDRYVRILNCEFINTGRYGCGNLTEVISGEYVTLDSLRITVPDAVRDGIPGAQYATSSIFGNPSMSPGPPCGSFCTDYTVTYSQDPFLPCQPLFADSVPSWAYCDPAGNLPAPPCGSYALTKTATPTETQPDSTVTFTIAVCNNTVYATPVVLSDPLPPAFTATGASLWLGTDTTEWSGDDTTLTLNNGQCAQFMITGYFTAFGEFTNTATLDTDTATAGAELSASATVSVVSACAAETIIPDSSLASVVGTVFSGTVNIQGLFVVDDDVLFQSAQVFMEAGAEIVVLPGFTLDIISSSVESCLDVMWKGITAQGGSLVRMRGSFVDDAENVVTALDGSTLVLRDNQFHNNRTTIHVPVVEGVPWNDVAIYALGNTFYSQGDMPQPYPGQATAVGAVGYAAFDVNYMVLDLTDGNNIIHHMSNGIVAHHSDVRVLDCRMLAIQPDVAYAYTGNGAGIYAYGGKGWNTLEQEGYGSDYTPSFEDCRWGIYTEYMNVYSTDNNMEDIGTAYRIMRSGDHEVDILNNRVHTKYHGMDLRFNEGAMHVLVEGNEITFGDTPCAPPAICRPFSAIVVTEGSMANTSSVIRNNTIQYVGSASSRYGINLMSADDWLVAGNTLQMTDNALNETGVWLQGCRRAEVSCNTVAGASTSYPLKGQAAIRNMMGTDPLISCNDVDMTTNGIIFNGVAYGTDLRGNHIRRHKWGLYLDGSAIIEAQILKGNLWHNQPAIGDTAAKYAVSNLQAANYQFQYSPATIAGGSTQPPSWSPPDWFDLTFGANYDCADDEGQDYCSLFNVKRGKEHLTELDVRVASDSIQNDPYSDETDWILRSGLYRKLDENPEFQDSLQVMAHLYADLEGSTTGAFKAIDDDHWALYHLDSAVVGQLQQGREQMETLMDLVRDGLEQLEDSTLTSVQRQAILAGLSAYRQDIGNLYALNSTALQMATEAKVITANNVQASNAGVAVENLIQENVKTVNDIYLATVGKEVDTFTATQVSELFAIANQCPMVGGNSVFKARSLYGLIDEAQEFQDSLLCLPYGIEVKNLGTRQTTRIMVLPNPAADEATLVLGRSLDTPGVFVLFDALGAEVLRSIVAADLQRFTFSTVLLSPALYHYQVRGPSGIIGDGKLTIVR